MVSNNLKLFVAIFVTAIIVGGGTYFAMNGLWSSSLPTVHAPIVGRQAAPKEDSQPASVLLVAEGAGGTFKETGVDTYVLRLTGVEPEMIWFNDRPARHAGRVDVQKALDALYDDGTAEPPNAALAIADPASAEERVIIIELTDPSYDAAAGSLSFNARLLDEPRWGLEHYASKAVDKVPAAFGQSALFIDNLFRYSQCRAVINNNSSHQLFLQGVSDPVRGGIHPYGDWSRVPYSPIAANASATFQLQSPTWGDDCRMLMLYTTSEDPSAENPDGFLLDIRSPATGSNSANISPRGSGCTSTVSLNSTSGVLSEGTVNFSCP